MMTTLARWLVAGLSAYLIHRQYRVPWRVARGSCLVTIHPRGRRLFVTSTVVDAHDLIALAVRREPIHSQP